MPAEVSRRSFLKLAAAGGAAAAIPGCKPAARHLIPYVIPDDNVIPGMPTFYATSCDECPAGCGVVARVREGRVIKLEGNPADPISAGGSCARGQAALQGLYNPDRLQRPHRRGSDNLINPITWGDAAGQLHKALSEAAAAGPDRVAFIGPPMGPAYERIVEQWLGAFNSRLRLVYTPVDDAQQRAALNACFGQEFLPVYRIDRAQVLVSLRADFLETWGSPVELSRQYAAFHTPVNSGGKVKFGLSYYVGPRMSITAAKCDHFFACRPGFEAAVALAMLRVIVGQGLAHPAAGVDPAALHKFAGAYDPAAIAGKCGVSAKAIEQMARNFAQADGAIALAGGDYSAHAAAWALNAATGNIGKTVELLAPEKPSGPPPQSINTLLQAMHNGNIKVAVIANTNPQFTMPPEFHFGDALSKVPLVVWCGGVPDETAQLAHLLLPINHWLEDWGDNSPRPGNYTLRQPTMTRVVYSRPLGDVLLDSAHAAAPKGHTPQFTDTQQAVRSAWEQRFKAEAGEGFDAFWDQSLREGGFFTNAQPVAVKFQPAVFRKPIEPPQVPDQSALTLSAYLHPFLYDGRGADKPWLQEIPEPVSQIVWDSWAEINPQTARRLDLAENDLLQLASPQGVIEVPVHLSDGVHPAAIAVPIGQGHTSYGRYARARGANVWTMLAPGRMTAPVKVNRGMGQRELVSPVYTGQMYNRPIVETMSVAQFERDVKPPPWEEPFEQPWELYPPVPYPQHEWGMTIDLNACTGCGACTAACYAENNVPFVGKELVRQGRIMSWIRLERYFPETTDSPLLLTMPMLCQQCSHAPCEPVCPVFASVHSNEGLNLQVYNRCIGTRYCENNCPYKVRRFNWFKPEFPKPLDLQLNPDVTVRGAGVMEKCTFCVQRIRFAEIQAINENRKVRDGEIVPACVQACPSRAMTFGDMKDANSAMMKRRKQHEIRTYKALDEPLNTLPAIVYLRQVYRPRGEV
jgi:anaerobic selenocysteine-containing dehydrogenase/Fe-S-cluster-containing dehydrogenase component